MPFLTVQDEEAIVSAIREAERNTSGEIRVHLESSCAGDAFERAKTVFQELEMHQTDRRNGVLVYVAPESRTFVICGDKGLDAVVPDNFWEQTKNLMADYFKKGDFKNGLMAGIHDAGEQLKRFFPFEEDDVNELPDSISKG